MTSSDARSEARMMLQAQRDTYAQQYTFGRRKGNSRLGAALYAYAYSRMLGWPWSQLRLWWNARP